MNASGSLRRRLVLALKAVITLGLLGWIAFQVDWSELRTVLATARPSWIALAVAAHALSFAILSVRWWRLLRALRAGVRYRQLLAAFYLGLFGNNFLPTGMGGDLLRILHLRSEALTGRVLLASVLMDRVVGLVGVLFIGLVALYAGMPPDWPEWVRPAVVLLLVSIPFGLVVFFSAPIGRALEALEGALSARPFLAKVVQSAAQLQVYRDAFPTLVWSLVLTVVLQSLVVLSYWSLGRSLGVEAPLIGYFIAVPLMFLLVNLPLSIGGLGVREGSFVALIMLFEVGQAEAVAISVLYLGMLLVLTLPGGLVLLRDRSGSPTRFDA